MFYNLSNAIANIKSGLKTKRLSVRCSPNNFNKRVLRKLTLEGYIRGFSLDLKNRNKIRIFLKYDDNYSPVIRDIKIISTSGKRVYFSFRHVLEAYNRGENYLLTTTKGLFSINELVYNRLHIGGEVILQIYFY